MRITGIETLPVSVGEGYDYVGRFAEKRTRRDFESLAQQYVLGPAGMTSIMLLIRVSIALSPTEFLPKKFGA